VHGLVRPRAEATGRGMNRVCERASVAATRRTRLPSACRRGRVSVGSRSRAVASRANRLAVRVLQCRSCRARWSANRIRFPVPARRLPDDSPNRTVLGSRSRCPTRVRQAAVGHRPSGDRLQNELAVGHLSVSPMRSARSGWARRLANTACVDGLEFHQRHHALPAHSS
jgi:hypothetical protein